MSHGPVDQVTQSLFARPWLPFQARCSVGLRIRVDIRYRPVEQSLQNTDRRLKRKHGELGFLVFLPRARPFDGPYVTRPKPRRLPLVPFLRVVDDTTIT